MKTNKALLIILTLLLSILTVRESKSVPCSSVNPPSCQCGGWTINNMWGNSILVPTGDPTCYYIITYNIRKCQCGPGYEKYQFKILGVTKYGNCQNKTDAQIFTEIYSFILMIAKDLFGIELNLFEIDIISPACYQWVGNTLQACNGNDCCIKTWLVRYNPNEARTEISSGGTQNEICSVVYSCPNLCDSLYLSDGTLTYPAWPSGCLQQDPCPDEPWYFNPSINYVYGILHSPNICNFIAFYETKFCENVGTIFRVKFIQFSSNYNTSTDSLLAKAVRRILNELNQNGYVFLLSYSCWTTIVGYDYRRLVPCLDVSECCYIRYVTNGPRGIRGLQDKSLLSSGNPNCSDNCSYVCEELVSDALMPLGPLPGRWAPRITLPDEQEPIKFNNTQGTISTFVVQNELVIHFSRPISENIDISIFNILGEKVYSGLIKSSNRSEFKLNIGNLSRGFYSFVITINNQLYFGTFLKH